jgi:hypothetical protein
MNKIPKDKWLEIYAALKLIQFYAFIATSRTDLLNSARTHFDVYNKTKYNDNDTNSFDSIPNGLSFTYLLLVRSSEILKRYLKEDYNIVKMGVWEDVKIKLEVQNFEEFLNKYSIKIIDSKVPENWVNSDDYIKVFGLISNLRNSISHWRYDIRPDGILNVTDRKNENSEDNFHIEIPYHQLLNLTQYLISLIHDYLNINDRIEKNVG